MSRLNQLDRRTFLTTAAVLAAGCATGSGIASATKLHAGRRVSLPAFRSAHVAARDIDIWIPQGRGPRRVVYAHDGKTLFDAATSASGIPLGLDAAMQRLANEGIEPAIIVGIASGPARSREYQAGGILPFLNRETADAIGETCGGAPQSAAYLRFIVEELKPYIDRNFATRDDRAGTFMLGTSMGGLVSLEALRAYPEVFRGVGCMSAHTLLLGPAAADPSYRAPASAMTQIAAGWKAYASQTFPSPHDHRIWIDRGTEELDGFYESFHNALVEGLRLRGYRNARQLQAQVFSGTGHHERWWSARCENVLRYLLDEKPSPRTAC